MTTLYCPKCGYNLSKLPENRCPECGEAFDPDQLRARQSQGISNRSIVLQVIFVPMGIALVGPLLLCGAISIDSSGSGFLAAVVGLVLLLGITMLHACPLSMAIVRSKKHSHGPENTPWIFRSPWPCCILFTLVEAALAFGYFAGGCAVIMMNMSFH